MICWLERLHCNSRDLRFQDSCLHTTAATATSKVRGIVQILEVLFQWSCIITNLCVAAGVSGGCTEGKATSKVGGI